MSANAFTSLISEWQQQGVSRSQLTECNVRLSQQDLIKVEALALTFHQDKDAVISNLLHSAIREMESHMPYIAGPKVIRVEEGDEVYEDIGPTPKYLAAQKKVSEDLNQKQT